MGLKALFRKVKVKDPDGLAKDLANYFKSVAEQPPPEPVSKEDYLKMREDEEKWLDSHYDFDSIEGVKSIPVSKDLPDCRENGVTGELYYRLKQKAWMHEDNGNFPLAYECMKKSVLLMQLKYGVDSGVKHAYYLVGMLARNGFIEQAKSAKEKIDNYYKNGFEYQHLYQPDLDLLENTIRFEAERGMNKRDYKWIQENIPEKAPKSYSGYMRMKNGKTKNFLILQEIASKKGRII